MQSTIEPQPSDMCASASNRLSDRARGVCVPDEISTGLDASTTYQIVRCISNMVHLREVRPRFATACPLVRTADVRRHKIE